MNKLSLIQKHKQRNARVKNKQSFRSENYNRTSHNKSIKKSADSIPPRSL